MIRTLALFTSKMNATGWLIPIGLTVGAAVAFLFGTATMAYIFVGLLTLDFITGVIASLKRGEQLTSKKVRDMWYKWITYLVILLVAACLDITTGQIWIHGAALMWIILSEGVSILENCQCILGRQLPFLGRIKKILDALRGNGANHESISGNSDEL